MLSELGLSKEIDYELNKKTNIIDVVIDERFDDANISRLLMSGINRLCPITMSFINIPLSNPIEVDNTILV